MKKIGIVVHNIHEEYSVELINGLEQFCNENGFELVIFPISIKYAEEHGFEYRHQAIKNLININNVDALVLSSAVLCTFESKEEYKQKILSLSPLPCVNVGIDIPGLYCVTSNSEDAFKKNVIHLIKKHKKKNFLLFTASDSNYDSFLRKKWFMQVLKENKIKIPDSKIINADFNRLNSYSKMHDYLEKNGMDFDCVVCLNDTMAFGSMEALTEKDIKVPDDVTVTGFDNCKRAFFSVPTLSTIDPQISKQGYIAGTIVKALLEGKKVNKSTYVSAKEKFRVSCGCISDKIFTTDSIDFSGHKTNFTKNDIYRLIHEQPQVIHNELYAFHQLIQHSLNVIDQEKLFSVLPDYINRTFLKAMSIFVYDKPKKFLYSKKEFIIPNKVNRIFTYEKANDGKVNLKPEYFNPHKNMFPENTFKNDYKKFIVYPLFERNFQYGYMIVPLEKHDYIFYEIILESFSKEITSAIKIFQTEQSKTKLEHINLKLEKYNSLIETLSTTDELTSINNRRGFIQDAEKLIAAAVERNHKGTVIFCDMDGLKKINDSYGHQAGDRAILTETEILKSVIRDTDVIGRFGGDEFAIAIEGMSKKDFLSFKKRIENASKIINREHNEKFNVSISMGASEFSKENCNLDKLLHEADKELYKVKKRKHAKLNRLEKLKK